MTATATFQAWLIKARVKSGLSYKQFASKADVSVATVHGIEHSLSSPSLDTVEKITTALGTSVEAALRVRNKHVKESVSAYDAAIVTIKETSS